MEAFVKNGITLLSAYDPKGRCEKAADAVPVKDRTLYFCPSPLYGYGLDKLLSRLEKLEKNAPNCAILCVEADPELYELSKKNILYADDSKICLTNIININELCIFVREKWGARAFRRIEMVKLTGGWQLFAQMYDSLFEALRSEITTVWSNAMTLAKLGRLYIRNFLRNLSLLSTWPSIAELSFGSSPVYVLGAGPSLDNTLDEIEKNNAAELCLEKRSFKIICVDTCLGALKERGIVPDLAVILESQHWNMRDFIGCCGWNVPFAVDLCALPNSALMLEGSGYLFMTPWTDLSLFERLKAAGLLPAIVPPLGSVGLTAVNLARRLTSGEITCAGLDFSFSMDKYHARGTPGHRHKLNTHNRFGGLLNTAVFGEGVIKTGDAYTNPVMRGYRDLFKKEFENILHKGIVYGQTRAAETQREKKDIGKFVKSETERLNELRDLLTGRAVINQRRLLELVDECDYLWGHFPDYAGGRKPDINDISFLNRVRVEIDFMIGYFFNTKGP